MDSSLWIEYYRPEGHREVQAELVEALAEDRVATMAMILVEVLRGAMTKESYHDLESDLTSLHWLDLTLAVARRAAGIGFDLDRVGKRVPATDLLIAATAIEYGHTLWHDDRHFETISDHAPLVERRKAATHRTS